MQHVIERTINAQKLWAIDETGVLQKTRNIFTESSLASSSIYIHMMSIDTC